MFKGIVRKLDNLGRIVVPKEMRREIGLNDREKADIYVENGVICIVPYKDQCECCNEPKEKVGKLLKVREKKICVNCARLVKEELDNLQNAEVIRLNG